MLGRKTTRDTLLALCSAVVITAQHCEPMESDIVHYDLSYCPDPAFTLPDSAPEWAGYRLGPPTKFALPRPEKCPAFKMYAFWEHRSLWTDGMGLRLNRGSSCSLDAAYHAPQKYFDRYKRFADIAASLAMQSSGVAPNLHTTRVERLEMGGKEFIARCMVKDERGR